MSIFQCLSVIPYFRVDELFVDVVTMIVCGTYEGVSFERERKGTDQMIHLHRSYMIALGNEKNCKQ